MSGHNKFSNIKHKKEKNDAAKGKIFTVIGREIAVAVKEGGADPANNSKLRDVIAKAKANNMPNDTIDRGIKKAAGDLNSVNYENLTYEGYGPSGVAIIVDTLTDNKNRTAANVRSAFTKGGGNVGAQGSVSFMFDRKGQIMVSKEVETGDKKNPIGPNGAAADEEEFMLAVAEAGGDDYEDADEEWIVYTAPGDLMAVVKELEAQGIQVKGAEMTMIANTPSAVSVADAKKVMRLIDKLEELEDLQAVYHTMDITDEIAEALDE